MNGMNCSDLKVQMGAVRCLHSLSRSVQQLRTTFQDHTVWKPLMNVSTERFNCNYTVNNCNNGKVEKFGLNFIDFVNSYMFSVVIFQTNYTSYATLLDLKGIKFLD